MAGIALILDLLKRRQSSSSIHSYGLLSATAAASAAATYVGTGRSFAGRLFGDGGIPTAYCDSGVALDDRFIPTLGSASEKHHHESTQYITKEYPIELKPLFSAFGLKSLAITSVRSFLVFYLPLLEPCPPVEDDDDFLQEAQEERHVDLVVPFKNSIKQIFRETTVVTTRRVLERLAVHYVSQRMAWKLLKAKTSALANGRNSTAFCNAAGFVARQCLCSKSPARSAFGTARSAGLSIYSAARSALGTARSARLPLHSACSALGTASC